MAGRHGVEQGQRRAHSRVAARQRRGRMQRRDAARGLGLWVVVWVVITLVALPAMAWSAYLLASGRGMALPVVALVAGACALLMVALDVRARRRHRRELPPPLAEATPPPAAAPVPESAPERAPESAPELVRESAEVPPPTRSRRSHRA